MNEYHLHTTVKVKIVSQIILHQGLSVDGCLSRKGTTSLSSFENTLAHSLQAKLHGNAGVRNPPKFSATPARPSCLTYVEVSPCSLAYRRNSKARGETQRQFRQFESSGFLLWCLQGHCRVEQAECWGQGSIKCLWRLAPGRDDRPGTQACPAAGKGSFSPKVQWKSPVTLQNLSA